MLIFAILAGTGIGALLIAWALFHMRSRAADAEAETENYVFRCPQCRQKLRYAVARAGKSAQCPRCRNQAVLPMRQMVLDSRPLLVGRMLPQRQKVG